MFNILKFPKSTLVEVSDEQLSSLLKVLEDSRVKNVQVHHQTLREQVLAAYRQAKPKHKDKKLEFSHYANFVLNVADKMSGWILFKSPLSKETANTLLNLRLQIARLALEDEDFLYEETHPIRVFLDNLADTFSGSLTNEDDEVFRYLQALTMSIKSFVTPTNSDPELKLQGLIEKEGQRALLAANRISNTIRAKVKMDEAQDTADRAISEMLEVYSVPEPMTKLLKIWKSYLVKEHMNELVSRSEWLAGVDRLADILSMFNQTINRQKNASGQLQIDWLRVKQQKIEIEEIMDVIGLTPQNREPILSTFEHVYKQLEKGSKVVMLKVSMKGKFHCAADFDIGFVTPVELEKALLLKIGDWIDFKGDDGELCRAKLIAKIPEASSMVFMSRKGPKVFEKRYSDIALGLENKICHMVNTTSLFTKAIEASVTAVGGHCRRVHRPAQEEYFMKNRV